jgi:DNA uptake protein ComE-like DNA-binding protein
VKLSTAIIVGVATSGFLLLAAASYRRKSLPIHITTEDLGYQEHSPAELASEHLLDLNTATPDDLLRLGVNRELSDRILDNRPYRNKLDLLSRMVIPEAAYESIKNQIGVAMATESVKIAG